LNMGSSSRHQDNVVSDVESSLTLESLSRQVNQVHQLQSAELQRKEQQLEELRRKLKEQEDLHVQKDMNIRRLEEERYRQQEERAMEIRRIYQQQNASALSNPYHGSPYFGSDGDSCQSWLVLVIGMLRSSVPACARRRPPEARPWRNIWKLLEIIHGVSMVILTINFLRFVKAVHSSSETAMQYAYQLGPEQKPHLKPWESTLPTPIALFSTKNDYVKQRHVCIEEIRKRLFNVLGPLVDESLTSEPILLVDPAYHSNVGGKCMLYLVINSLKSCVYSCFCSFSCSMYGPLSQTIC
jgi:hypothetical protein